ncbi:YihY/virulence factor BrkB family protein [Streptomyces sp. G-G2]|uniref:YihY/virulence factor BrkB family protein n=1 Tax=Streptomyces sp. G-G2 TaxID=3046201 RepID=UPI0024BA9B3C|nr:YihY/virulence factor BrkB family protein [Streptomyces sp. G-G2]MDJ0386398.1 YihY/virulence factor BrkB family protein [Streptomyces sp. G-G2]
MATSTLRAARNTWKRRAARTAARVRASLWRTVVRAWDDNIADHAAALTYYAVLALVPALLISVSLVGLAGDRTQERLIAELTSYAPPQSAVVLRDALNGLVSEQSSLWALLISGVVSALWSASSYLAVFRRALHAMYRVPDTRPPLRAAHTLVLTAAALLVLLVVAAAGLVASGPLALRAAGAIGFSGAGTVMVLRWPVLLLVVTSLILILFRTGPARARGTRRALPGGVLAAALWLSASGLFTLYTQFGTYSRLYGSLAGIVVFLVWLWVANLALLSGAQFNAELARDADPAHTLPERNSGTGA